MLLIHYDAIGGAATPDGVAVVRAGLILANYDVHRSIKSHDMRVHTASELLVTALQVLIVERYSDTSLRKEVLFGAKPASAQFICWSRIDQYGNIEEHPCTIGLKLLERLLNWENVE